MSAAVEAGVPRGHASATMPIHEGSLNTFRGSGDRVSPVTPRKAGGKIISVKVLLLDDSYTIFQIQSKALGALLLEQTCRQINLIETDYFALEYTDGNTRYWLDLDKPLNKQVCLSQSEPVLRFCVKFYTPDPAQLEEEYTRYLFALQIKRDIALGELICNENTAAIMASYIVQAECGDYLEDDYPDHCYLSLFRFLPTQNDHIERSIMENHKRHIGMTPASADMNLLETARRCELYGVKMHSAKDHEGVQLNLSVAHMGLLVFQNYTKINTFSWAKIRKISFKRKKFLVKLHPEGYGYYKDVVEFYFEGRNECKNFWKKCVEHHGFFRCSTVKKIARHKTRVLSKGSSFRYSGRTQRQVQDFVRDNYAKRKPFQRSQSFRSSPASHAGFNIGINAQPLVSLRDNQCVGTPASLSCGSVTLASMVDTHSRATESMDPTNEYELRRQEMSSRNSSRQGTLSPDTSFIGSSPHKGRDDASNEFPHSPQIASRFSPQMTPTPFTQSQKNSSPSSPGPKYVAGPKVPTLENGTAVSAASKPPPEVAPKPPPEVAPKPLNILPTLQDVSVSSTSPTSKETPLMNGHHPAVLSSAEATTSNPFSNEASPSPEKEILDTLGQTNTENTAVETKRKKSPSDRSYFIVKEMLTTERTYKKDLEVLVQWFREEMHAADHIENVASIELLFDLVDPIYELQSQFLSQLENKLAQWDVRSVSKNENPTIVDLMQNFVAHLKLYEDYANNLLSIFEGLDSSLKSDKKFEELYRNFENEKICYLPLTSFMLKPLYRLRHYYFLIVKLVQYYDIPDQPEFQNRVLPDQSRVQPDFQTVKSKLEQNVKNSSQLLSKCENLVKLIELQRDLVGIDNLVQSGREFVREGCLQKLSRKGYQQRMFFLFNDVLLYTNRTTTPTLQFKVHGQLPLRGVMVEENESRMGANNCFTIYGGNRALMVAATNKEEKERWLSDMKTSISNARTRNDESFRYLNLKSIGASDEILDRSDILSDEINGQSKAEKAPQTRSNTTVHVCWHRATSVSASDYSTALQNQVSGYLLRKFKNSMGWQKLWVVFTNFCLFFYKTYQDDFPLASLPLLGYSITTPNDNDQIQKEFVFKLQFKNHVYFFRAESEYTFSRWMEIISMATNKKIANLTRVENEA